MQEKVMREKDKYEQRMDTFNGAVKKLPWLKIDMVGKDSQIRVWWFNCTHGLRCPELRLPLECLDMPLDTLANVIKSYVKANEIDAPITQTNLATGETVTFKD